jgi:predicted component of type VI protein secretion system
MERATRHRERRERRSEEYRLREQQGLSSSGTEEYSSSDEEEEEVRGQALPDRWEPAPSSPEPALVAGAASLGASAEAPCNNPGF